MKNRKPVTLPSSANINTAITVWPVQRARTTSVPQTIIIGRDGRVKAAHVAPPSARSGPVDEKRAKELEREFTLELERELEALLAPRRAATE